jgi:ABC-type multidrug transport system ATPase subunit
MYFHQSTLRHIAMVLHLYGADGDGVEKRVLELLEEFDLLPFCDGPVGKLSRGQLYKAGLTALLAVDPELWLLDEPFASGMDPLGISAFKKHARTAAQRGRTILYTTQILDLAEHFSDRVCLLHHGEVRAFDTLAKLRQQTRGTGGVLEGLFQQLRETGK